MKLKQKYAFFLFFSCLIETGFTHQLHQSGTLLYIGEFRYQSVISFVKGKQSCGFSSQIFSSISSEDVNNKEASAIDYTCLTFLDTHPSHDTTSWRITDVDARIQANDITYKFRINPFNCTRRNNFLDVRLHLTCVKQREYAGKTCTDGTGCDDEREFCRPRSDFGKKFCIPKRKYNESCGMHLQCYGNTNCEQTGREFLCQCKEGFEFINGECLKVGIRLKEECNDSRQCTGTENATECIFWVNKAIRICFCDTRFIESNGKCLQSNRRLYEQCESSSQCRGSFGAKECRSMGGVKLCFCSDGYLIFGGACLKVGIALGEACNNSRQCTGTENAKKCVFLANQARAICSCDPAFSQIDGKCLRSNQSLYEPCESSRQCTGSAGATECKYMEGVKLCFCPRGYDIFRGRCLKVGIAVGGSCWIREQCSGTKNAQQCKQFNETGKLICDCNPGFLRHGAQCLQVNRTLYEDCLLDNQCNGTTGMGVCKKVRDRGICVCASNFVEDKETLRCRKAARMFESSKYDLPCTGTPNAYKCIAIGDVKICHCSIGHIEIEGKCRRDDRKINDTCEIDQQCNGTEHAAICGENGTCICDVGFLVRNEGCIPDKMHLPWIHEKNNQLILVGAGGFLFGIFISIITLIIRCIRNKQSRKERLNTDTSRSGDNTYYAYAVHGNFGNVMGRQNPLSDIDCNNVEDLYDTAHQTEERVSENWYDISEPLSIFRGQNSDKDVYMYNHLHEKETQLCENLYDVSVTIPVK